MLRFTCRRVIVVLALLCQVLTAGFVHVPAAHAMTAPMPVPAAQPHHCHDDARAGPALTADTRDATVQAAEMPHGSGMPDAGHHCKSGFCFCVCAHAVAAMPTLAASDGMAVMHAPLLSSYHVPTATRRPTPLFRPPI